MAEETKEKAPRGLAVVLSKSSEQQVRRVSKATRLPIKDLRDAIEASAELEAAVKTVLKREYDAWRASGFDLFKEEEVSPAEVAAESQNSGPPITGPDEIIEVDEKGTVRMVSRGTPNGRRE